MPHFRRFPPFRFIAYSMAQFCLSTLTWKIEISFLFSRICYGKLHILNPLLLPSRFVVTLFCNFFFIVAPFATFACHTMAVLSLKQWFLLTASCVILPANSCNHQLPTGNGKCFLKVPHSTLTLHLIYTTYSCFVFLPFHYNSPNSFSLSALHSFPSLLHAHIPLHLTSMFSLPCKQLFNQNAISKILP